MTGFSNRPIRECRDLVVNAFRERVATSFTGVPGGRPCVRPTRILHPLLKRPTLHHRVLKISVARLSELKQILASPVI